MPAGCDHQLGSTAALGGLGALTPSPDQCGVCNGDNSSCRRETGRFNKSNYGYNFVVRWVGGGGEQPMP